MIEVSFIPMQAQQNVPPNGGVIDATLPGQVDKQTGVLLPNPPAPICEVGIESVLVNGSVALQDPNQPTAYPVPSLVSGQLSLQLANLQTSDMQVRTMHSFLDICLVLSIVTCLDVIICLGS